MDADCETTRRVYLKQRENRWSMNSQRLEQIVAQLMKPVSDARHSFDTDLSALLEEYLTEAGIHALEQDAQDPDADISHSVNFTELALLLQQSASIYGRKVDFLYQHVMAVSDSLQADTVDDEPAEGGAEEGAEGSADAGEEAPADTPASRKRKALEAFSHISLAPAAAAGGGAQRAPPTLPRAYLALLPAERGLPLRDRAGEPIGMLHHYYVSWRLQDGLLVEHWDADAGAAPRPVPLAELQAAIAAAAPATPPRCSTPLNPGAMPPPPPPDTPAASPTPAAAPAALASRKRKVEHVAEPLPDSLKLVVTKALRDSLVTLREFHVDAALRQRVWRSRARDVLRQRAAAARARARADFPGFTAAEAAEAAAAAAAVAVAAAARERRAPAEATRLSGLSESEDDGFFEQSDHGDSDHSNGRADDPAAPAAAPDFTDAVSCARGWAERAAAAPALDVRACAARVLAAAAAAGARAGPVDAAPLLRAAAPNDLSHLFLATLFLANAGSVELASAPLAVDQFTLRLTAAGGGVPDLPLDQPS